MADVPDDGRKRMHIATTPREAYEFVRNLASNRELQEQLKTNPEKVLKEHGIHFPGPAPQGPVTLPPDSELRELADWIERSRDYSVMTVLVPGSIFTFGPYCLVGTREPEGDQALE